MQDKLKKIGYVIGLSLFAVINAMPIAANAATAKPPINTGQALEIAPPLIYLTANPGETKTAQILIRDVANTPLNVTGEVNDFVASGETGTPRVILNNDTNNPYSLKSWVGPLPTLQLVPKQIKTLTATINVPKDASPGGHYGVVRFTGTAPSVNGGNGVSLSASIGALMLLTVSGNIHENLSVKEFSVSHKGKTGSLFQSGPLAFVERISNTGNVHEQPTGAVVVKDMFGRKLGTLPVNQPPGNVLPGSTRRFTQSLDKSVIGTKKMFGRYTATLTLTYGTKAKHTLNATTSYWVVPLKTIAIIIIILVLLFFGLRWAIRRYNQSVLNRANRKK